MPSHIQSPKSPTRPDVSAVANALFDQFVAANTFHNILNTFQQLCMVLDINMSDHRNFYRRLKSRLTTWKAQQLWKYLDKRASHKEYKKQTACINTRLFVIGCGPCGLRMAIEGALLGAKVIVVEKRDRFSRNNVLHLWPFLITDLKSLGAKKFFGKFCAGAIDHISIRTLQCILCKVSLLYGVQIYVNTEFQGLVEPPPNTEAEKIGWHVKVLPEDSAVNSYEIDVLIGADGKRNTLEGFKRKEFRGKLAIAITANFINRHTMTENKVEEISGVAFIFNQKFFKDLAENTGIDLENIVYYKDETHYFVMTTKKTSLLEKGVLNNDYSDTVQLLSRENINQKKLLAYAKEAANESTNKQLPNIEFALNHYGQPDVAVFDFTSLFQSRNAARVVERNGHKLLVGIVGDSLLEPFWPTGSGCARGFLGCFDAAWMMKSWTSGKMTPLEVIAERESIFQLLSQTSPENLNKEHNMYTIDPNTRYRTLNSKFFQIHQVRDLYDCGEGTYKDEVVELPSKKFKPCEYIVDSERLLKWCQRQLEKCKNIIKVTDMTSSWKNGMALCALINLYRPDLIKINILHEEDIAKNNQLAFNIAERELGISPVMTGQEMAECEVPDKLTMVSYISQFYELFRNEKPVRVPSKSPKSPKYSVKQEEHKKVTIDVMDAPSPTHRSATPKMSLLSRLSNKIAKTKRDKKERESIMKIEKNKVERQKQLLLQKEEEQVKGDAEIKELKYGNLAKKRIQEIDYGDTEVTLEKYQKYDQIDAKLKEHTKTIEKGNLGNLDTGVRGSNKVSAMAEALSSKMHEVNKVAAPPLKKLSAKEIFSQNHKDSDFCYFCQKRVYLMERQSAEGYFFHRGCLRCEYCNTTLRPGTYAFERTIEGEGKFYCVQHLGMKKRLRRKRSFTDMTHAESKENIPDIFPDVPLPDNKNNNKSRTPLPKDSLSVPAMIRKKQTPERVEFEMSLDESMIEEDEEKLIERNLRSVSQEDEEDQWTTESEWTTSEESDSESENTEQEWESYYETETSDEGEEDDDVIADEKEAEYLPREGTCKLVKEWQHRHSTERLDKDEESGSENEEEDNEEETDEESEEDEEDEDEQEEEEDDDGDKMEPSMETLNPSVSVSKVSPNQETARQSRKNFFMQAPEPVRIDPISLFGKDRHPSKLSKEKSLDKIVDIDINSENKSREVEENVDMIVSNEENSKKKLDKDNVQSETEEKDKVTESQIETQGDVGMATDEDITSQSERVASSASYFETDDGIIYDKDTEFYSSGEIMPVSLASSEDLEESDKEKSPIFIDDRFVTPRKSRKSKAKRGSDSSFTISTPTGSVRSMASSLEMEVEYNKTILGSDYETSTEKSSVDKLSVENIVSNEENTKTRTESSESIENVQTTSSDLNDSVYMTPKAQDNKHDETHKPQESAKRPSLLEFSQKAPTLSNTDGDDADFSDAKLSEDGKKILSVNKSEIDDSNEPSGSIFTERQFSIEKSRKKISVDCGLVDMDNVFTTPSPQDDNFEFVESSPERNVEKDDKFYTPMTSVKPSRPIAETPVSKGNTKVKKRLLPETPKTAPSKQPSEQLKKFRELEHEKLRQKAREKARLKSDEELGVKIGFTPRKLSDSSRKSSTPESDHSREITPDKDFSAITDKMEVLETVEEVTKDTPEIEVEKLRNDSKMKNEHKVIKSTPELAVEDTKNGAKIKKLIKVGDIVNDTPMKEVNRFSKDLSNQISSKNKENAMDAPELYVNKKTHIANSADKISDQVEDTPMREVRKIADRKKHFFSQTSSPVRLDANKVLNVPKQAGMSADHAKGAGDAVEEIRFADESSPDKTPREECRDIVTPNVQSMEVSPQKISAGTDSRVSTLSREGASSFDEFTTTPSASDTPVSGKKEKKGRFKRNKKDKKDKRLSTSPEMEEGVECDKKEKRKSWFAMLISPGRSKDKKHKDSPDVLESKDRKAVNGDEMSTNNSAATGSVTPSSGKEKKIKTKDKKKGKRKSKGGKLSPNEEEHITSKVQELILQDRQLSITSEEERQKIKAPLKSLQTRAPRALEDEFTDSDSELMDIAKDQDRKQYLQERLSRRLARRVPSTEEDRTQVASQLSQRLKTNEKNLDDVINERMSRRVQRAARKQQRQQELKRLRMAQEIQRQLEEVEVKHKDMEDTGVEIEKALRGEGSDSEKPEGELMQEWFNLVHEKNILVRYESELMVQAKELELEDRHSRLEQELREKMAIEESKKTPEDVEKEKKVLEELLEVVEQRDALVKLLEEDRVREKEEDKDLQSIMERKGFQLSPITYCKSLSKWCMRFLGLIWLTGMAGTLYVHVNYSMPDNIEHAPSMTLPVVSEIKNFVLSYVDDVYDYWSHLCNTIF